MTSEDTEGGEFSFVEYHSGSGLLSTQIAERYPRATVISVEPDNSNIDAHLKRLARLAANPSRRSLSFRLLSFRLLFCSINNNPFIGCGLGACLLKTGSSNTARSGFFLPLTRSFA